MGLESRGKGLGEFSFFFEDASVLVLCICFFGASFFGFITGLC